MATEKDTLVIGDPEVLAQLGTRRSFLRLLGVGGTIVLLPSVFAACNDDDNGTGPGAGPVTISLADDNGILNYAYALEQLEAGFYTLVLAAPVFGTLSVEEREVFTDLQRHEVIHREFFRNAIPAGVRIPDLQLTTSAVTTALATRASLLLTSETFEDLGVAAYNGAGKYLTNAANLLAAGKIVSVEARHAAAIRDLRDNPTTGGRKFANSEVVNAQGLDVKLEFEPVYAAADPFIETRLAFSNRPGGQTPDQAPTHS